MIYHLLLPPEAIWPEPTLASFKNIARNVASNYLGVMGSIIIAFFLSPYLVRTLGDTGYGVWSILASLTAYMSLLDLGVTSAVAKYVSEHRIKNEHKSSNEILASAVALLFFVALALVAISPLIASFVSNTYDFDDSYAPIVSTLIVVSAIDMALYVMSGVLIGAVTGLQRYDVLNIIRIVIALLKAGLFYLLLSNGYGLVSMASAALVTNVIAAIAMYIFIRRKHKEMSFSFKHANVATSKKIFAFSKFTFVAMVAGQVIYYSDALVIGFFMSAAAITYYSIPWSLSEYTSVLLNSVSNTFMPVFSELNSSNDQEQLYDTYIKATRLMLVLTNLICFGILAVGGDFIGLWMGEQYQERCTPILIILFAILIFKGPQTLTNALLQGMAKHKRYSMINLGLSFVNLGLNIVLVQKYGLLGIAAGTAITQIFFSIVVGPIMANRLFDKSVMQYFMKTYVPSIPPALVLYGTLYALSSRWQPDNYLILFGEAILATLVYLAATWVLFLDNQEKSFILEKIRERRQQTLQA